MRHKFSTKQYRKHIDGDYLWSTCYFLVRFYPISLCQILSLSFSLPHQMKLFKYQVYLCMFFNLTCSIESWTPCLARGLLPRWSARRHILKFFKMDVAHSRILLDRAGWIKCWIQTRLLGTLPVKPWKPRGWKFHSLVWKLLWKLQAVHIGAVRNKTLVLL